MQLNTLVPHVAGLWPAPLARRRQTSNSSHAVLVSVALHHLDQPSDLLYDLCSSWAAGERTMSSARLASAEVITGAGGDGQLVGTGYRPPATRRCEVMVS